MNTPAHAVVNLLVAGRQRQVFWAVLIGAVLPDAAMVFFYGWQKFQGQPEQLIWSELYFAEHWQRFFDLFNSLPLLLAGALVGWFAGSSFITALMLSMLLHGLCDLPLHNNDAHRHFYPFSEWRFLSPLSYWDPTHFGRWVSLAEAVIMVAGSAFLLWLHRDWKARSAIIVIALSYAGYWLYASRVWQALA